MQGWRMNEIDDMDIIYYLKTMAYKANKANQPKRGYIDDIWKCK